MLSCSRKYFKLANVLHFPLHVAYSNVIALILVINKGRGPGGNGLRNEGTSHASLLWKEELLSVVKFRSRRFGVRKRGLKSSDSTWPDK